MCDHTKNENENENENSSEGVDFQYFTPSYPTLKKDISQTKSEGSAVDFKVRTDPPPHTFTVYKTVDAFLHTHTVHMQLPSLETLYNITNEEDTQDKTKKL